MLHENPNSIMKIMKNEQHHLMTLVCMYKSIYNQGNVRNWSRTSTLNHLINPSKVWRNNDYAPNEFPVTLIHLLKDVTNSTASTDLNGLVSAGNVAGHIISKNQKEHKISPNESLQSTGSDTDRVKEKAARLINKTIAKLGKVSLQERKLIVDFMIANVPEYKLLLDNDRALVIKDLSRFTEDST